ncbi:MAG TPA: hypothetical protein VGR26_13335 [Acidimicrobiales bacterium]|nr:hypothetical protein [Acidimicrobiales bacterium]
MACEAPADDEDACRTGARWSPSIDRFRLLSDRITVNDDASSENTQHYDTGIAIAPNGRVDIAWYDRAGADVTNSEDIYFASLHRDGETAVTAASSGGGARPWAMDAAGLLVGMGVAMVLATLVVRRRATRAPEGDSPGRGSATPGAAPAGWRGSCGPRREGCPGHPRRWPRPRRRSSGRAASPAMAGPSSPPRRRRRSARACARRRTFPRKRLLLRAPVPMPYARALPAPA